ncbi:MAG: class I SAM-dependent methyltransferase [Chloroflexota bacterium]
MHWREVRATVRQKYVDTYDASEADRYDNDPGHGMSNAEVEAYWSNLQRVVTLQPGSAVLDVGTGDLCRVLLRVPGVKLGALEPSPAMLAKLTDKLPAVTRCNGFTDAEEDRSHFSPSAFDAIVSRQVVCGLFDPLQAFKNWHYWLKPHGLVIVIDGICSRESWTDHGQAYVDVLPLAS